jgi:glycosyltransferase involved in cell wall biosynthesis
MKKRVALITTYFPPANGVAVNRMKAFATYLSESFEIEVFTIGKGVENPKFKVFAAETPAFFNRIAHVQSDSKLKHHAKTLLNIGLLKTGLTENRLWKKRIQKTVNARNIENPFDVIISSFAPIETHEIAFELKEKYPSLIWVADMRDEMSKNPFAISFVRSKLRKKELQFQEYIDLLTTVSKPILDDFKVLMPKVKSFLEVRNGYDHDITIDKSSRNDFFTMLYAGTFYGENKPNLFLKMVAGLVDQGLLNQFKIQFLGTSKNFKVPSNLESFVEFIPKVSYAEAVEYMHKADCNLLFCVPTSKGRFTGKVFDYLSVETPILALVDTEDVAADLIVEVNGGLVGDFYDLELAKENLLKIYKLWSEQKQFNMDHNAIQALHRRNQVGILAREIQKLLEA